VSAAGALLFLWFGLLFAPLRRIDRETWAVIGSYALLVAFLVLCVWIQALVWP